MDVASKPFLENSLPAAEMISFRLAGESAPAGRLGRRRAMGAGDFLDFVFMQSADG